MFDVGNGLDVQSETLRSLHVIKGLSVLDTFCLRRFR